MPLKNSQHPSYLISFLNTEWCERYIARWSARIESWQRGNLSHSTNERARMKEEKKNKYDTTPPIRYIST